MKYFALAFLFVAVLAGGATGQERPLIRYKLDNGLDVVLAPDHRVPKIVFNLSYRVGSMNEPPGRSGFAHLFEHLMFSGTPAFPDIDAAYGAVGVDLNAWTWEDKTLYYAEGLSSTLPLVLALEADRMAHQGAAIAQEDLDVQRAVVLNEMRETVLDTVNASGWEAMRTALFPAPHPYSRAVIGSMADLAAATLDDVHGFFDTYYVPNNAILVLVGDFAIEDARSLIEQTFGLVPRGPEVPRPSASRMEPARARIELEDRTPTATLSLGWSVPEFQSHELGSLRLAAELLGNPEYGVLRQRLVETGVANGAWAWLEKGYLGSRFLIEVSAADGAAPAAVEAALKGAVSDFLAAPLAPADLERARRKLLLSDRVAMEPLKARAEQIALYADMLDAPEAALADDPRLAEATLEDVHGAIRRYLEPTDATVMVIHPGDRGGYPEVLTSSSGIPQPFAKAARPSVEIPRLAVREPSPAALPQRETATLSNGIEVFHYQTPGAPMSYIAARSHAGTMSAPEGKEGIVELAAMMGTRGAGDRDLPSFAKAAKDIGADVEWKADDLGAFLILSTSPESLGAAMELFADAVRDPLFEADEWRVAVAETLDDLKRREGDLPDVAARAAEAALFPKVPGEPAIDRSLASVRSITRKDAAAIFHRVFSPASVTFHSVGSLPLADVVAELEKRFGDWRSDVTPLPPATRRPAVFPDARRVLLVPEPGASQSAIYVARPAPGFDEPGQPETVAVFRLLGYDFISRLNSVIREEKGYSYGTDGELMEAVRTGSALVIETTVERDNTGPALIEIFKGFQSLTTEPVRGDELDRTVTAHYAMIAGTGETAAGLFEEIWEQLSRGSSLEEEHARRLAITGLELDAVRTRAAELASLDRAVIVIVGDPDVVLPQLQEIGLSDVEIVDREGG